MGQSTWGSQHGSSQSGAVNVGQAKWGSQHGAVKMGQESSTVRITEKEA